MSAPFGPDHPAEPEPASGLGPEGGCSSRGPLPIARQCMFFGQPTVVMCDARCDKAWGINARPRVQLSDDDDDYASLADHELGVAPADPGTYEGGHAKPQYPHERLNKWCIRECERSAMSRCGRANETITAPDFSRRFYNMPWLHTEGAASVGEARRAETSGSAREHTIGRQPETPIPIPNTSDPEALAKAAKEE